MNKSLKKIVIVLSIVIVVGIVAFPTIKNYMVYNFGKRDVQSEEAAFTLKTKDIVAEFIANEAAANKKYLEKPVAISGVITSVNAKEVVIDASNAKLVEQSKRSNSWIISNEDRKSVV